MPTREYSIIVAACIKIRGLRKNHVELGNPSNAGGAAHMRGERYDKLKIGSEELPW